MDAISQVTKLYGSYDTETYDAMNKALEDNNLAIDPVWVATRVRLKLLMDQWKSDATGVTDRRVARSEVLNAVQNPSLVKNLGASLSITLAKTKEDKFELAARALLELLNFPSEVSKAIRLKCVETTPVKQVLSDTTYGTDIERWPVETPASFWTGIALAVFGLLLGPIVFWVGRAES